ncbi:MAG TPA: DUF1844 domain-containing protein [Pyrinomonadaceae bacterium]|nr:DUF1844 domain-containing protein [Pyrinomonadaceae bacterium]
MSDEQTNFKVTDRRLFNPDGTPRDIAPEPETTTTPATAATTASAAAPASEPAAQHTETQPSQPASQAGQPAEVDEDDLAALDDPAGFVNFVMSIASNAASSMGMMEHPVTHQREVNLEIAKHWIDVLGMLETKTHNNLLPQEEKILEGLLADLRMQYVSLNSSATAKASGPLTGRDIVGG